MYICIYTHTQVLRLIVNYIIDIYIIFIYHILADCTMLSGTLCMNNVEVLNVITNTTIVLLLFSINFTFSVEFFTNLRVEIITHWQAGSIRCTNMLLCLVVRKGAESTDSCGHPLFSIADSLFISVAN